jgi:hypothetical protein
LGDTEATKRGENSAEGNPVERVPKMRLSKKEWARTGTNHVNKEEFANKCNVTNDMPSDLRDADDRLSFLFAKTELVPTDTGEDEARVSRQRRTHATGERGKNVSQSHRSRAARRTSLAQCGASLRSSRARLDPRPPAVLQPRALAHAVRPSLPSQIAADSCSAGET